MPLGAQWIRMNVPELENTRGQLVGSEWRADGTGTVRYRQEWRLVVASAADTTVTTATVNGGAGTLYADIANRYTAIGNVTGYTINTDWAPADTMYLVDQNAARQYITPQYLRGLTHETTLTVEGTANYAVFAAGLNEWAFQPALSPEAQAKAARRAAFAAKRREIAVIRARRLLADHLTNQEHDQLAEHGYFEISSSSGRRYRIYKGHSRNVVELDAKGREINRLCAYPNLGSQMPDEDHMLAQKLLLENDEAAYRKVANHSRIYIPGEPQQDGVAAALGVPPFIIGIDLAAAAA